MREGPLAALFRKTAEDREQEGKPRRPGQAAPAEQPPEAPPAPPSEPAADTAPPAEQPRVPTPQERLRHAFSSDIPENVMERRPEE